MQERPKGKGRPGQAPAAGWLLLPGVGALAIAASLLTGARTPTCPYGAPCDPLAGLDPCGFRIERALRLKKLFPGRGSDRYGLPDPSSVEFFKSSVAALVAGNNKAAFQDAVAAGYVLCRGTIEGRPVALWRPLLPGGGRAVVTYRPAGARPVIFSVPHPVYDRGTLSQAVHLFALLEGRALIVAGTHRCASPVFAGCQGETGVCGDKPEPYRESDMAHVEGTIFHGAHQAIADSFPADWVVSLHGMGFRGIRISNGTSAETSSTSRVARLARSLRRAYPRQPVKSCNEWDGMLHVTEQLCGTTNVQGRYINGLVENACVQSATVATGRFIHLEQSKYVRRHWEGLAEALHEELPDALDSAPLR